MTRLRAEAGDCYSWSNGPGDRYGAHDHGYEKVLYCVDGSITFFLEREGKHLELKAGRWCCRRGRCIPPWSEAAVAPASKAAAKDPRMRGCGVIWAPR